MVLVGRVSYLLGQHGFLEVLTLGLLVRVGARGLVLGMKSIIVNCVGGMVNRRQLLRTLIKEVSYVGGGLLGMPTSIDYLACHDGHGLCKLVNTEAV